jgi:hypothetical protein
VCSDATDSLADQNLEVERKDSDVVATQRSRNGVTARGDGKRVNDFRVGDRYRLSGRETLRGVPRSGGASAQLSGCVGAKPDEPYGRVRGAINPQGTVRSKPPKS